MQRRDILMVFPTYSLLCFLCLQLACPVIAQQTPLKLGSQDHTQGYRFDPLLHLPGLSPYFDVIGFGLEHTAPLGCNVTAASYLVRHAAIYANDNDYETFIEPFLKKLNSSNREDWSGPLSVFKVWSTPYSDPENEMEKVTPEGARDSMRVAHHLLKRYPDLVPTTKKVYADKKTRTQDTAKAFVKAFPQGDDVEIVQISTDGEFQSTIPHKSCPAFTKKAGDDEFAEFIKYSTNGTLARFKPHSPVKLTAKDIIGMQQLCGYESAINGLVSDICGIFTPTDWLSYEYAWDLKYSYMVGPGNPLSPYLGFPWLNVTAALFSKFHAPHSKAGKKNAPQIPDDDGQRFFVSFTHREVPPFLATALGLFNSSSSAAEAFPTDRINFQRSWKMAELIPFLGHIGIEKLSCDASSGASDGEEFVRIIANSAPRPIPRCQQGPGASCGFHEFEEFVEKGLLKYGDFEGACKVEEKGRVEWK